MNTLYRINDAIWSGIFSITTKILVYHLIVAAGIYYLDIWIHRNIQMYLGIQFPRSTVHYIVSSIVVILYGKNIKNLWVYTPANHGQIMENRFPTFFDSNPTVENVEQVKMPTDQRALLKRRLPILPWEKPVGQPISLSKHDTIEIAVEAQSEDGVPMVLKGSVVMTPIKDQSLVWYLLTDNEAAKTQFKNGLSGEIQRMIRGSPSATMIADPQGFFKSAMNIYAGDRIGKEERKSGRTLGDFKVSSCDQDPVTQKRDRDLKNAPKIAQTVQTVRAAAGPDPVVQQMVVAAALEIDTGGIPQTVNVVGTRGGRTP